MVNGGNTVKGNILIGNYNYNGEPNVDTVRFFMDTDINTGTGYIINGLGADYMVVIHGQDGSPIASLLYIFDPEYRTKIDRNQNDWNAWNEIQKPQVAASCNKLEAQIVLSEDRNGINENRALDQILAYVQVVDAQGNADISDDIISNKRKMLIVTQNSISDKFLKDEYSDLLHLEFRSAGTDVTINSISYTHEGIGDVIPLEMPIKITKDTTENYTLKLDTKTALDTDFTSLKINSAEDIDVADNVPVILNGTGSAAYINRPPHDIIIDGAFGDWERIDKISNEDGAPVGNPNVDISNIAVVNSETAISFYVEVKGTVLAGTKLPTEPYIYYPPQPLAEKPPHVSVSTHDEQPLPDLPIKIGEDSLYFFLDSDQNTNTGYRPDKWFNIGADYMVKLTGQNGEIIERKLHEFKGDSQTGFHWVELNNVSAACGNRELETQVDFSSISTKGLGRPGMDVYIHIVDWYGDGEYIEHRGQLNDGITNDWAEDDSTSNLIVHNSQTRMNEGITIYSNANHTFAQNNFKHGDVVYFTITDDLHFGGIRTATISCNDDSVDAKITIFVYDDGTNNDENGNDGVYSGCFIIQSLEEGGFTNDKTDTIAVAKSVTVKLDISQSINPASSGYEPLHAPEFANILSILPIILILILVSHIKSKRNKNNGKISKYMGGRRK